MRNGIAILQGCMLNDSSGVTEQLNRPVRIGDLVIFLAVIES